MSRGLVWIEAQRTWLMTLVVGVHVNIHTQVYLDNWWPGGLFSTFAFGLAVPTFMLISGYVLATDHAAATAPGARRALVVRRLRSLLLPFVAWNVLMIGLEIAIGEPQSAGRIVLHLFTGYWHLYFLFALAQLHLLFAFVLPRLQDAHLPRALGVCVGLTVTFYAVASTLLWTGVRTDAEVELVYNRLFVPWIGYFCIGVALARRTDWLDALTRNVKWIGLLALLLYVPVYVEFRAEENTFWDAPLKQFAVGGVLFQLVGAMALFAGARRLSATRFGGVLAAQLCKLAPDSHGVYLCHNAILIALFIAWKKLGLSQLPALSVPLLWVATLLLAFGVTRASRHLGAVGRLLFAARRPVSQLPDIR